MGQTSHFHVNTDFSYKLIVDFGGCLPWCCKISVPKPSKKISVPKPSFHVNTDFSYKLIVDFGGCLPWCCKNSVPKPKKSHSKTPK